MHLMSIAIPTSRFLWFLMCCSTSFRLSSWHMGFCRQCCRTCCTLLHYPTTIILTFSAMMCCLFGKNHIFLIPYLRTGHPISNLSFGRIQSHKICNELVPGIGEWNILAY